MDSQKINEQRTVDPGDRAFLFGRPLYVLYVYKSISPGNLLFIDKKGKSARLTRALFLFEWVFLFGFQEEIPVQDYYIPIYTKYRRAA